MGVEMTEMWPPPQIWSENASISAELGTNDKFYREHDRNVTRSSYKNV